MQQLPSWQQAAITAGVNKLHALAEVWSVAAVGGPCTHTVAWLVRILLQQHQVIQPQLLNVAHLAARLGITRSALLCCCPHA